MHSRQLVDLAAVVAMHGPVIVRSPARLSNSGLQQYWSAAKCRLDRWGRALKEFSNAAGGIASRGEKSSAVLPLLEEILTSEVLLRVWTAILTAYDARRQEAEAAPIARSIWQGQLEARQRVLQMIVSAPGLGTEQALRLNRLRRRCERWSDLLLGYLLLSDDVLEFAFDPERARDFAEGLREQQESGGAQSGPLLAGSLRMAFHDLLSPDSANPDLNEQIASGILSCFPGDLFDAAGMIPSLWLIRMKQTALDTQGLIDDLLAIDVGPVKPANASSEPPIISRRPSAGSLRRFDGKQDS